MLRYGLLGKSMIRILLGSALPLIGLGLAAATLGPTLSGPRGAPLIMASTEEIGLQAASFEGEACPSRLLFADGADGNQNLAGTHILAFALRSAEKDVAVEVEDFAAA